MGSGSAERLSRRARRALRAGHFADDDAAAEELVAELESDVSIEEVGAT